MLAVVAQVADSIILSHNRSSFSDYMYTHSVTLDMNQFYAIE